jgi:methyl-accepting chemotaxis protein/hemerythrin
MVFPIWAPYKVEHMKLTKRVIQFKTDFDSGKVALTIPALSFLDDWLVNHIQGLDKAYGKVITATRT